ncbi:MAG: AAA family ATPase, partial [bacterium]|nr:AAA family ATPase [bacterium]
MPKLPCRNGLAPSTRHYNQLGINAGTGKTTMLNRARTLAGKKGWRMTGLAPSASAAETLASEAGIPTETLQRFLARNAGVAEGRLTRKGA